MPYLEFADLEPTPLATLQRAVARSGARRGCASSTSATSTCRAARTPSARSAATVAVSRRGFDALAENLAAAGACGSCGADLGDQDGRAAAGSAAIGARRDLAARRSGIMYGARIRARELSPTRERLAPVEPVVIIPTFWTKPKSKRGRTSVPRRRSRQRLRPPDADRHRRHAAGLPALAAEGRGARPGRHHRRRDRRVDRASRRGQGARDRRRLPRHRGVRVRPRRAGQPAPPPRAARVRRHDRRRHASRATARCATSASWPRRCSATTRSSSSTTTRS